MAKMPSFRASYSCGASAAYCASPRWPDCPQQGQLRLAQAKDGFTSSVVGRMLRYGQKDDHQDFGMASKAMAMYSKWTRRVRPSTAAGGFGQAEAQGMESLSPSLMPRRAMSPRPLASLSLFSSRSPWRAQRVRRLHPGALLADVHPFSEASPAAGWPRALGRRRTGAPSPPRVGPRRPSRPSSASRSAATQLLDMRSAVELLLLHCCCCSWRRRKRRRRRASGGGWEVPSLPPPSYSSSGFEPSTSSSGSSGSSLGSGKWQPRHPRRSS